MKASPKLLMVVFSVSFLFCALASGQANQQPASTAGSSSAPTAQQSGTAEKSAAEPNQASQGNAAKPAATQKSSESANSAEQPKDSAQSTDKSDEDAPKHRSHIHLGTISFGAGYTRYSSGFFFPYYGYGFYPYAGYGPFYSPFVYGFYDPFYGPYYSGFYPGNMGYAPDKGEVKLDKAGKGAQVYLNGAFAGPADKLKSMWLDPGAYDLSVSTPSGQKFEQRIYVISGKTLKIRPQVKAE
jgi:hypothetical protein